MGFAEATKTCFRKYFVTSGRASRSEYWWFILATILMQMVGYGIDGLIFGFSDDTGPIEAVVSLAVLIPTITALVRRLHDTGRPGYFFFVPLLFVAAGVAFGAIISTSLGVAGPIIAFFIMAFGVLLQLWWLLQPSDPTANQYGPNPFEAQSYSEVFE